MLKNHQTGTHFPISHGKKTNSGDHQLLKIFIIIKKKALQGTQLMFNNSKGMANFIFYKYSVHLISSPVYLLQVIFYYLKQHISLITSFFHLIFYHF